MKATKALHDLGQSLWLDNITRDLLDNGTLNRYIDEFSVTGLTSNPTIFDHAIKNSSAYDAPIWERTERVDGWVSLEVSPLLAYDPMSTLTVAKELFGRAQRPNLLIKIPGTKEGLPAIEEAIFAGIPVNVTLLFSREHYLAAVDAYIRGIERRIDAGLNP